MAILDNFGTFGVGTVIPLDLYDVGTTVVFISAKNCCDRLYSSASFIFIGIWDRFAILDIVNSSPLPNSHRVISLLEGTTSILPLPRCTFIVPNKNS